MVDPAKFVALSVVLFPAKIDSVEVKDISCSPRSDVSALELRMLAGMRTDSGGCVLATLVGHSYDVVMLNSRKTLSDERLAVTPRRVEATTAEPLLLLAARRRDDRVGVDGPLRVPSLSGVVGSVSVAFPTTRFGTSC